MHSGERRREKQTPSERVAWCGTQCQGPAIMTWAKGKFLTDWATQAPSLQPAPQPFLFSFLSSSSMGPLSLTSFLFSCLPTALPFSSCSVFSKARSVPWMPTDNCLSDVETEQLVVRTTSLISIYKDFASRPALDLERGWWPISSLPAVWGGSLNRLQCVPFACYTWAGHKILSTWQISASNEEGLSLCLGFRAVI